MKTISSLLCLAAALAASADITLYNDTFKRRAPGKSKAWRMINTRNHADLENNALVLKEDKRYISNASIIRGEQPFGGKFRFTIEKTDPGSYKMGILLRGYDNKDTFHYSEPQQGKGRFEFVLPRGARRIELVLDGKGQYKDAKFVRLIDNAYHLEAYPAYQLVKGEPEKVTFKLFHNEKEVPGAEIKTDGLEAAYPASGATVRAYIEKGDPAPFDAVAQKIRLEKPVSILYIGDSLTHYDIGHNHVDKVGYFLNKFNPGKAKVWNYACAGDDIQRIVDRINGKRSGRWGFRYDDLWNHTYDWAVIFLGHNDTKASSKDNYKIAVVPPEKQRVLYEALIKKLQAKGIKRIILMSSSSSNFEVCKANSDKLKRVHNRFGDPVHQEAFNEVLKELAKKYGLEYMDLYTPMKARPDKAKLLKATDGVHLSPEGHDFVALETLKYLSATNK